MSADSNESHPSESEASDYKARAWFADFNRDEPLYKQFPVRLVNGKSVPGIRVVCGTCGDHLTGDHLRGTVVQSLRHVVTISANGLCAPCQRITHVDFRFRAGSRATTVEWLARNGKWQAREVRPSTLLERAVVAIRRMFRAP